MSDDYKYVKNEAGEVAVSCQIKIASDCVQQGEYCDDEEDARDWVEDECWIDSGEGFLCPQCNEQVIRNLRSIRPKIAR